MDAKLLTESGLKAILSKHKVKDNGLQKALAAYDKLADDAYDDCLDQLAQIGKLAAALKKVKDVAANKAVADYLDDLLDAKDGEEKDVNKDMATAAKTDAAKQKAKKEKEKEKDDEDDDEDKDDDDDDEEEEGEYGDRLFTALKKLRTMNGESMAFVICEARPLPAIMLGRRISSKHRKELTGITEGSKKFHRGTCRFEDGKYFITTEQEMPGMVRRVQLSVKNHTGKKFKFVLGDETAGDDEDTPEEAAAPEEAPRKQAPAAEAPAESAKSPQAEPTEALEDRRRFFKKARAAWVQTKTQAEEDLEKVKNGAHEMYLHDLEQFPKIVTGCKDIDAIMNNLDDELRDTLDQYASTSLKNQARLHELAETAGEILDRYSQYVEGHAVMKAIDMKEFADVTVHAPVMKALKDLRKALV